MWAPWPLGAHLSPATILGHVFHCSLFSPGISLRASQWPNHFHGRLWPHVRCCLKPALSLWQVPAISLVFPALSSSGILSSNLPALHIHAERSFPSPGPHFSIDSPHAANVPHHCATSTSSAEASVPPTSSGQASPSPASSILAPLPAALLLPGPQSPSPVAHQPPPCPPPHDLRLPCLRAALVSPHQPNQPRLEHTRRRPNARALRTPRCTLRSAPAQAPTGPTMPGVRRHHYPLSKFIGIPCPSCSLPSRMHLRGASLWLASRLHAPISQVTWLLREWLVTTAGWCHLPCNTAHADNQLRLLTTLHLLHTQALSLLDHHSSDTSFSPLSNAPVTPELAGKGIGPVGCVPIPPDIWVSSAPGGLLLADARTPPQKASNCPLVQAILDSLLAAGLVALHPGLPNAEAFVKRKSSTKAALIINMRALNANCPSPPPKFRLPTLLQIGALLRSCPSSSTPPCVAILDLANCFWSIRLPQSNVGCIRIGTPRHTYTLLALPFGWTHAPAIAQRVVQRHLPSPHGTPTHTVQYLDDISFFSDSPEALSSHLRETVSHLSSKGFLISPKSVLEPLPAATFIGKLIDVSQGTISSLPAYYAGVVLQWLSLATGPFSAQRAGRLLGKLIWLAQPRRRIHPFLAGPYAAIRFGHSSSPSTSLRFTFATLEALAMCFPSWRALDFPITPSPSAPRFFADAACSSWGAYFVGIWESSMGIRFFPCPSWVLTQQAAELYAALKALSLAVHRHDLSIHLYLDNHAAIYSLLRGKARSPLIPQNRLLRRLNFLLHWSGVTAALHYVPSHLNPADPASRWWSFSSPLALVSRSWSLGLRRLLEPPGPAWGLLSGLNRAL